MFGTRDGAPMLYPASGTGATEAALVNALAPGDRVLVFNYGVFSGGLAQAGPQVRVRGRRGQAALGPGGRRPTTSSSACGRTARPIPYRAVLVVHNETSTGVTCDIAAIRKAMDAAGHDALLIVDTVSSLASIDFRMDEWGVDIVICG